MKILNELYDNSCRPGYKSYKKITDKITLIDNFFEDFDSARNFFISREKWECIQYQDYSKPGCETFLPNWVGKSLIEKYILDNKINDDMGSYAIICNFSHPHSNSWSLSGIMLDHPHFDCIETNGLLGYIVLINLNLVPVTTNFYTFKDKEYCDEQNLNIFRQYDYNLCKEFFEYCGEDFKNVTRKKAISFLNGHKKIETKLIREIKYNPNQAIVYPANLFHCPNITSEFSEKNLRTMLRISFVQKIRK